MPLDTPLSETEVASPLARLYYWESNFPQQPYLFQPVNAELQVYTWQQVGDIVRRIAARLLAENYAPGSRIGILAKNSAEWFMVDLAIMMAGHVSVPIFSTAGQDTISFVLAHAEVKLLFVGKLEDTPKQIQAVPDMVKTVAFPYPDIPADQQWAEFIDVTPLAESPVPDMGNMMTIIYTSGSTGKPKGVVHTFTSACWAASHSIEALKVGPQDRVMSYLPLAHITERVLVELVSLYSGQQIYFVEALETFNRDVKACQPTLFISVPRLWTKFQMGVLAKMPQKKLDLLLSFPIVRGLVARKIRQGLGLDKCRIFASGSAPLPPPVITWFTKIGIDISEGWGMTENSAYGTGALPFRRDKIGSIGTPYEGVELRISPEGEIQVKSPCNMEGYYLDPEKTKDVFTDDGFLKTGDKGVIDDDGYVRITGRLKDIFKTAKGKYVTPAPIEARFMENPAIEQVCVVGNNLPQPIALVVLSEAGKDEVAQTVDESLLGTLQKINSGLESHQVIDHVIVMRSEWTIDNGLLTPTLKVKRHVIEEQFEDIIAASYDKPVIRMNR